MRWNPFPDFRCYNPAMLVTVLVGLIGWAAGALVNYLADVLPYKRALVTPFCHTCGAPQSFTNYLLWPRRCDDCRAWRTWRVWIVEIAFVAATLWLWLRPPPNLNFLLGFILLVYFGLVTLIDLEHRLIMHPVSIAGAILGLGIGTWLHGFWDTLLGGVAGFVIMLGLYVLGSLFARLAARIRGETLDEEALGFGDVNLAGVLGLILGWPGIIMGLVFAILLGGLVSGIYMLTMLVTRRFQAFTAIPYGPFLIAGAMFLLYFRSSIIGFLGP